MYLSKNRAKFERNIRRIEIMITYACNMSCYNCEAMVRQAPASEAMTVEQIEKFVAESIEHNKKWESIRVIGGEPTVHKDVIQIFEVLQKYKEEFSPETVITIVTNGHGDFVKNRIKILSEKFGIKVDSSDKVSDEQYHFTPINQAPIDYDHMKNEDLTKGCWITSFCGIALSKHGYYPCTSSAAIDRVFGFDKGRKDFPADNDSMNDLFEQFCKLCGHYEHELNNRVNFDVKDESDVIKLEEVVRGNKRKIDEVKASKRIIDDSTSPTWTEGLDNWRTNKPVLTKY